MQGYEPRTPLGITHLGDVFQPHLHHGISLVELCGAGEAGLCIQLYRSTARLSDSSSLPLPLLLPPAASCCVWINPELSYPPRATAATSCDPLLRWQGPLVGTQLMPAKKKKLFFFFLSA